MNRTIHQIWVGSPVPDRLKPMMATWRTHHPGWNYRLWDEQALAELNIPHRNHLNNWHKYARPDGRYQLIADLHRFTILATHGGIYADADTRCLKPLDPLLDNTAVVGWEVQDRWVGTSTLYFQAGHPALEDINTEITRRLNAATRPQAVTKLSGPQAVTPVLRDRTDVTILNEPLWYPVRHEHALHADKPDTAFPNTYVVHGWDHQRALKGQTPFGQDNHR